MSFPFIKLKIFFHHLPRFFLFFLLLLCTGCGTSLTNYYFGDLFGKSKSSTIERSAEQLALDGMQQMRDKDYDDALKSFQQLKEHYPYSKYAILAELKLGDAHFYNKDYGNAVIAYEEFARLHPRNEVIPYVLYQIGMCHFLSFSTVDRDQEETRLAIEAFQRLIQTYPQSEYAQRGKKQLFECQKRIVAHEFQVGQFYFRLEQYASAKVRLDMIKETYPEAVKDLGYQDEIDQMLARCATEVVKEKKKPSIWTRIGF